MFHYEVAGRTVVMTIDRPEARNAINGEIAQGLEAAVERIEADPEIWSGVLTGAGGVFSAGADLKLIAAGRGGESFTKKGSFGGFVKLPRTKPIIAAVDGAALAGGFELALACDLIVASIDASFGLPEVKRSLLAIGGGLVRLPRMLPTQLATHMLLTGDALNSQRAFDLGLVCELTEPGQALGAAVALAERINTNAPLAVRQTLQIIHDGADQTFEDTWKQAREAVRVLARTDDFAEGPRAFIEKRPPVWRGQ